MIPITDGRNCKLRELTKDQLEYRIGKLQSEINCMTGKLEENKILLDAVSNEYNKRK